MKALFIDDDADILRVLRRAFPDDPDIAIVGCRSVEEALQAIDKEKPSLLFLDNSLSRGGNEGLEIVDRVKERGIKIYLTTTREDEWLLSEYEKRGIERVSKIDFDKIKEIIVKY